MERREFLKNAGKAAVAVTGFSSLAHVLQHCTSATGRKWNIVFILADDQGWNQAGYQKSPFYESPNVDRIVAEGMYFSNAYSANPVCSPTRASLMTGRNPARLHLTDYIPGSPYPYQKLKTPQMACCLPLEEKTIAEMLKENSYVTGHFGKWHLSEDKNYQPGRPHDPGSQGFDEVFTSVKPEDDADPGADSHHAVEITGKSIDFIKRHKDDSFFCYVSHHVVHRPLMEKQELVAKYEAKEGADNPVNNPIMAAMIERMDTGIGQILATLDELKLTEKTIVIYFSDNGGLESLQEQDPLRGGKATLFEGGIHVPMAIRWPGVVEPGTTCDTPVISDDFFATLGEMVGANIDNDHLDGISIVPLLKQNGIPERDALYFHYPHYHHQGYKPAGAIRQGDYKLIEWFEETLLGEEGQINLYNLKEDIGETKDLSAEMPELATQMRQKLHDWRRRVGAQEMTVNPAYDPKRAELRFPEE